MVEYKKVRAGYGEATLLPDMDFETYSEAGYYYDEQAQKWRPVNSSPPYGIGAVGAAAYTEHESAEILCLAYDLKDGLGARLWTPALPNPQELFDYLAGGGLIEAHNSTFEFYAWNNIAVRLYGWPSLRLESLRCSASKSAAFALPRALAKVGDALQIEKAKDGDGKRLLNKFSKPRKPTKKNPALRLLPSDDPKDGTKLYEYCVRDIEAEAEVSSNVPDLSPSELELWLIDQEMNTRGVYIDRPAVKACIAIVEAAFNKYDAELKELTQGVVSSASEVGALKEWCATHQAALGLPGAEERLGRWRGIFSSFTKDSLPEILKLELNPEVRRAIEIRQLVGSASVKKLYALDRRVSKDSRLRDMILFCGADRTGRFAGRGPQPQNLPNSGPTVAKCSVCGAISGPPSIGYKCTACGEPESMEATEWGIEAVDLVLSEILEGADLPYLETEYGDALDVVSGCLRGLFCAAPGNDLMCSDYSAIEAVVLAAVAGEEWRLDVFRTHGKIYEMSAAKITGIPFEEFKRHKEETGDHHPMRKKVGKVAELACFAPDTLVLTDKGYTCIKDVTADLKLWDGVEWVQSDGAILKGKKEVIDVDGVRVTPEHPISLGDSWREAKQLASSPSTLRQALAICSESLPSCAMRGTKRPGAQSLRALAGSALTLFHTLTSTRARPRGAETAGDKKLREHTLRSTRNTPTYAPIPSTGGDLSIGYERLLHGATRLIVAAIETMALAVSRYATSGGALKVRGLFSSTFLPLTGGTARLLRWIGSTRTSDMRRVILDSSRGARTGKTKGKSETFSAKSIGSESVYDIVNAGPRSRFTIKTDTGHLIVHNSGYQGGYHAWLAFGADKHLDEFEIKNAVKKWRAESPSIVKFWYGVEDAARTAIQCPGHAFQFRGFTFQVHEDVLYIRLLSGRILSYHKPRLHPDTFFGREVLKITYMGNNNDYKKGPKGWMRLDTYGGKLTENIVQATARDIMTFALVNLHKGGYPVAFHVHDEIISEIPEGHGSVEEFESIMATLPEWCKDWPIRAAGGWRGKRYRKD